MYLWKCKSRLYLKNPFINFAFKSVNMMHGNLHVKRENFNFETKYALIAYIWEKIWKKKKWNEHHQIYVSIMFHVKQ